MANSKIEWTESTWNPVTGCTKLSTGCENCYAERMAKRLQAMGQANYVNGFEVTTHPHALGQPLKWKKPKMIFVCSMGDLFHEDVPLGFIQRVFDVMSHASWHTFQVLTKRSRRMNQLGALILWPKNVWLGVSVETEQYYYRIDNLRKTNADTRFLSLEPLLGAIPDLDLTGIDWVIVGGESGPHARPMKKEWAIEIRDQCIEQEVPFFFKQWGGVNKKETGRVLDGRTWDEMPHRVTNEV